MYASCSSGFRPFPSRGTKVSSDASGCMMTVWLKGFTMNKCIEVKKNDVAINTATTYGIIALCLRQF